MLMNLTGLPFAKGHGTGNDFVIVPDPHGARPLAPAEVAALCDRHTGIGGDGLLRVVRTRAVAEVAGAAEDAEWFMDYRNADGSLAQMCGNGARVFARYLVESGLAAGDQVSIWTRSGRVTATVHDDDVSVTMPVPTVGSPSVAALAGVDFPGTAATCGNPNLVCFVDEPGRLDLTGPVRLDRAAFRAGANVEFVARLSRNRVRMRVVERGVGETLSCGSGACAVAAVVLHESGRRRGEIIVDVPGGRLRVRLSGDECLLTGPATIVASGTVRLPAGSRRLRSAPVAA